LIKYNRIRLYRIKLSIELLTLVNWEKYILIIFLKFKDNKLRFLLKFLLKTVNSKRLIKQILLVKLKPLVSKKNCFKLTLNVLILPLYKNPLDQ
jgi:hypothetical protein